MGLPYAIVKPVSQKIDIVAAAKRNTQILEEDFDKVVKKAMSKSTFKDSKETLIDKRSKMHTTHQIHNGMSCYLMKADLSAGYHGTLRYYIAQLLKSIVGDSYVLWTRWGRIGEYGQNQTTPFALDKAGAEKEFKKIFSQKTGHVWGSEDVRSQKKGKYRVI